MKDYLDSLFIITKAQNSENKLTNISTRNEQLGHYLYLTNLQLIFLHYVTNLMFNRVSQIRDY